MATQQATSSFSMSRSLHRRLRAALPRHGDRSKLVARMIEMYLNGEITVTNVALRNTGITQQQGASYARREQWQRP